MTGLENATHDLSDAQFSIETAIELLGSIEHDDTKVAAPLHNVIEHLRNIKSELDNSYGQLVEIQQLETH